MMEKKIIKFRSRKDDIAVKQKPQARQRILTGDRPTGRLHIGHYVGSLVNRVKLQHKYETYILVADLQALTDNFEHPDKVAQNVREVVIDYLSVGIDPEIATIVIQSTVPEIAELTTFFMNLVTLSRLQRNPTVKQEMKEKQFEVSVPMGFLTYPVSQAADIAVFQADLVPVGEDQLPMIEQTREIVRDFNRLYGKTLIEPEARVSEFGRLPGLDGKAKMSKSLGNVIELSEPTESLRKKIMSMYTDPTRLRATDPGHVEGNPVFIYLDAFCEDKALVDELKNKYRAGKVGDVEVKRKLFDIMDAFLEPIRKKRSELERNPEYISKVMEEGTRRGRAVASSTIKAVKAAIGIDYFSDLSSFTESRLE
jgi:tryptophanyl-tRNA synthetase